MLPFCMHFWECILLFLTNFTKLHNNFCITVENYVTIVISLQKGGLHIVKMPVSKAVDKE